MKHFEAVIFAILAAAFASFAAADVYTGAIGAATTSGLILAAAFAIVAIITWRKQR